MRDFRGVFVGSRVGDAALLQQGVASDASAHLEIDQADLRSLTARLTVAGLFEDAPVSPIPAAEADILSTISLDSAPVRVYLSFVPSQDGGGDALCVVSLHAPERIELRVLRGGQTPLYAIFVLDRMPEGSSG